MMGYFITTFITTIVMLNALGYVDEVPQEAPMIERCELFNTTLKSYDHHTATCENGIEFKRSAL